MCSNPHMIVEHKNKKTEINGWERNKEDSKRRELAEQGWDSSSFMPYYILKQCGFFWSLGSLGYPESIRSLGSLGSLEHWTRVQFCISGTPFFASLERYQQKDPTDLL